jgi:hypothetical protein
MDRRLRIPDDIINRLLTGLPDSYRQILSVGYPLPTDVDTNWAFPVFIQIQNVENFQVLGLQHHFTHYGATVYDMTLTSLASHTSLAFYLITAKNLAQQPLPAPPEEPAREEAWEDE